MYQSSVAEDPTLNERLAAVALTYMPEDDNAPKVVAKGQGEIAKKIIELARENGVEIRQDQALVKMLSMVDLDEEIPVEAMVAVAEILSFIYRQNGKIKRVVKRGS